MENTTENKSLSDLIENPSEISDIISNPAESGVKFYQGLPNKDKQYVIFAAGFGLLAYGLYLNRTSGKSSGGRKNPGNGSSGGKDLNKAAAPRELNVKKNH